MKFEIPVPAYRRKTSINGVYNDGFQSDSFEVGPDEKRRVSLIPKEPSDEKFEKEKRNEKIEDEGDGDIYCGVGTCRPNALQRCKNMVCFSAIFSVSGLVTSALNFYITSQITTLEKNFSFSSSVSGFLLSCNDLGYLLTTLIMSYYTRKVHIPRAMALSTIVYGAAGILCAVAFFGSRDQLASPPKENDGESTTFFTQTCQNITTLANSTCDSGSDTSSSPFGITTAWRKVAVVILAVGMIVQGMAKSPRQPFVGTYVDDNVPKTQTTMYIGVILAVSFIGPACAFGLGSVFSNMYITLEETRISPRDPRWLGAWWLGFIVFGAAGLVVGIPLIFFPKKMHKKREIETIKSMDVDKSGRMRRLWQDIKGLLKTVLRLILNPVYLFLTLANAVSLMAGAGGSAFFSKYFETQFTVTASETSLMMGAMNILIACLGSIISGCITTRFKMSPLTCLKFLVVINIISGIFLALGFVFGCDNPVVHKGQGTASIANQNFSDCVRGCNCDDNDYFPICGDDGQNYFSPCHAGCQAVDGMTFSNCRCMSGNTTQTATGGLCVPDCNNMYPLLAVITVGGLCLMFATMPSFLVSMRCVKEADKPFAIGFLAFITTLLGWFPGPVIFGNLVDTTCIVWTTTCGTVGACSMYDIELLRLRFHMLIVALRFVTVVFFAVALIFALCSKKPVFENNFDDVSPCVTENQENGAAAKKAEAENIHKNAESWDTYI